jgi:hypothetical protein
MEFNYHNCGVGDALLQPMVVEALEDGEVVGSSSLTHSGVRL